jgi:hypothetical protein
VWYILFWNCWDSGVYFVLELNIPHCHNSSKAKYTTLSQQFQSQIYPTVATVPKQNIPHCRNSSKTKYTTLSQQFQNKIYPTVATIPKRDSGVYFVLELLGQWGIFGFGTVATVGYILFWNCCDSGVYLVLELLRPCGIFGFGTVATVGYILLWNCCDSGVIYHTVTTVPKPNIPHCRNSSKTKYTPLSQQFQNKIYLTVATVPKPSCDSGVYFVLELLRQCGIFCFGTVVTMGYILFWNCYDSGVYFVLELLRQWGIFCFGTVATVGYILL